MRVHHLTKIAAAAAFALSVGIGAAPAAADDDEQKLVDNSLGTVDNFLGDPDMDALRDHVKAGKAVLIVPEFVKAGFIFGGEGGAGLMVARGADGSWSNPAFYELGGGSAGFQFGASDQEVMLVVMTDAALRKMMDGEVKAGGDIDVAAGPSGAGVRGETGSADVYGYVKQKGGYIGVTFDGAEIEPDKDANKDFYGEKVTPEQILIDRKVSNPGADKLIEKLSKY